MVTRKSGADHNDFGEVFAELGASTLALIASEAGLAKAELKVAARRVERHAVRAGVFGFLLALSWIPFLAFAVLGLGELLGGRYWLSSLVVAVLAAGVGGALAFRSYGKLRRADFSLPVSRRAMRRELEAVAGKSEELRKDIERETHEIENSMKRRPA